MQLYEFGSMYIANCNFTQNAALEGSVIESDYDSYVDVENCNFYENFGLQSAVIRAGMDGGYKLVGGSIYNNIALSNIISELVDSTPDSFVIGMNLYNNSQLSLNEFYLETR